MGGTRWGAALPAHSHPIHASFTPRLRIGGGVQHGVFPVETIGDAYLCATNLEGNQAWDPNSQSAGDSEARGEGSEEESVLVG